MKTASEILNGLEYSAVGLDNQAEVHSLTIDSRKAKSDSMYAAIAGTQSDGHDFIDQAIDNGATLILCSRIPENKRENVGYIKVADVPESLGTICNNFYGHPSHALQLVGVTGTNGKTTVATLCYSLFTKMGYMCGLLSTVENKIGEDTIPSTHTTPDIISLYALMAKMVEEGCKYCFMEVSSHALVQKRVAGLHFAGAVFTNLTHDHLDYHKTFDNYRDAKKLLFDGLSSDAFALINKDDRNGKIMLQNSRSIQYSYALRSSADFRAKILESDFNSTLIQLNEKDLWINLVGEFNVYNLLAVYGVAFILTEGREDLPVLISALPKVNGRFEAIQGPNNTTAIVDYAHTPDALQNVIETINQIRKNNVQLITIVGCGGNRDKTKRPEMGKIAARLSDKVLFTSDNPRDENPEIIIDEMVAGVEGQYFKKILRITDRKEAIRTGAMLAKKGDVILIAGKGHENYQEINGQKFPFDDKETIKEIFTLIA